MQSISTFFLVSALSAAALTAAVEVSLNTELFQQSGNPQIKLIPNDFKQLSKAVGPDSPLLLFIRSGEADHNTHKHIGDLYRRMLHSINENGCTTWERDERLQECFDPKLSSDGVSQAKELHKQLQETGWLQFLHDMGSTVQYLTSPLSRSVETAVYALPDAKFILDDGIRQRMTPVGPETRRNFDSPLNIGGQEVDSLQSNFKHFKGHLEFKMAKLESGNIVDRFGLYGEEDPNLSQGRLEQDQDLDARIVNWIAMIHPKHQKQSKVVKLVDKVLPNSLENKIAKVPPKVYVIVANSQFITGVLEHFNVDFLQHQGNRPNYCEMIPIMLQFHDDSNDNTSRSK